MTENQRSLRDGRLTACIDYLLDGAVTLVCWLWFLFGFLLFFCWGYLAVFLFSKNKEFGFQRLNHHYFQVLFFIIKTTSPKLRLEIAEAIKDIRSAVVLCNHLSYLDPLLLITLFPRQKTIVKPKFFDYPIFGWLLKHSGYLPATSTGRHGHLMVKHIEAMTAYLQAGGNLFVFPEGTRSKNGELGQLNQGALKIARICHAPIYVLRLSNTDRLFPPGRFFFRTRHPNIIRMEIVENITPDTATSAHTISTLEEKVCKAFNKNNSSVHVT